MPDTLAALIAFIDEHRWCDDLDGGLEDGVVWLACSCGAGLARVAVSMNGKQSEGRTTPMERETLRRIRDAVRSGTLRQSFTPADVNRALRIGWAGNFLPKHRVGNPGGETERFVELGRGLYRLK